MTSPDGPAVTASPDTLNLHGRLLRSVEAGTPGTRGAIPTAT